LTTIEVEPFGILRYMEKQDRPQKPTSQPCSKCGQQPKFITSMLYPSAGRTFHMFECVCGEKSWAEEKS
jgi:hypothetical protein